MRWVRLLLALLRARFKSRLSVIDESQISFRVWLTDIDVAIMNNAALVTALEMGRLDLMVRCGFFALARRRGWYFPVRTLSVRFVRPLRAFSKVQLKTRIFHVGERWIYLEQDVTHAGKRMAHALVSGTVREGRAAVPIGEIMRELRSAELPAAGGDLVEAHERANQLAEERLDRSQVT